MELVDDDTEVGSWCVLLTTTRVPERWLMIDGRWSLIAARGQ